MKFSVHTATKCATLLSLGYARSLFVWFKL
jgi:hypothetical protein